MKKITVLLAEDHMIVREGFRKMLELDSDLVVESVAPADDDVNAVYQYLIGAEGATV